MFACKSDKPLQEANKKLKHFNSYQEQPTLASEISKVRIARSFNSSDYRPAIISKQNIDSSERSSNSSYEINTKNVPNEYFMVKNLTSMHKNGSKPEEYFQIAQKTKTSTEIPSRLSSTSSSNDTSTSTNSSYGILNLINSQTCLLNRETIKSSNYESTVTESLNSSISASKLILNVNKEPVNMNSLLMYKNCLILENDKVSMEKSDRNKQNSYLLTASTSNESNSSASDTSLKLKDKIRRKNSTTYHDVNSSLGHKYSIRLAQAQINNSNMTKSDTVYIYTTNLFKDINENGNSINKSSATNGKEVFHLNNSYV